MGWFKSVFKSAQQKRIDGWVEDFRRKLEYRINTKKPESISDLDVIARYLYLETAESYAGKLKIQRALEESLKLQAHYASLLNTYDGGKRIVFNNIQEWLERLDYLDKTEENLPTEDQN